MIALLPDGLLVAGLLEDAVDAVDTGAAVAGSLATGVDTLGAEVPAGLKY